MIDTRRPISFETAISKIPSGDRIDAQHLSDEGARRVPLDRLDALYVLQDASEIFAVRVDAQVQAIAVQHEDGWLVMQAAA